MIRSCPLQKLDFEIAYSTMYRSGRTVNSLREKSKTHEKGKEEQGLCQKLEGGKPKQPSQPGSAGSLLIKTEGTSEFNTAN